MVKESSMSDGNGEHMKHKKILHEENTSIKSRVILSRGKWKAYMTLSLMAKGFLWNNWKHVKWTSKNPKMK
jgi:hypothetical protein